MTGIIFIGIIFYIIYKYKNGGFSNIQINEGTAENNRPLTQAEQEALKAQVRERLKHKPDPHYMPKKAKVFTQDDIEAYHNVLDECDTDGCDVSEHPVQEAEEIVEYEYPLVWQLAVAEAISRRVG